MADEIKVTLDATIANGKQSQRINPGQIKTTQSTVGMHAPVVTINSSVEENVSLGDLTTPAVVFLRSLEATTTGNFVKYGLLSSTGGLGTAIFHLRAGDPVHVLRLSDTGPTLRMQADTAAVKVQVWAFEK